MDKNKAWDTVAGYLTMLAIEKGLAGNSREAYQRDLGDLIDYCVENQISSWEKVSPGDITNYISKLNDLGIASVTIGRRLSAFRGFFKYLCREGIADNNPAKLVLPPQSTRKLPDILSVEEIERIIDLIETEKPADIRDKAIIELLYSSGLRVSELVRMKLSDLLPGGLAINVLGKGGKQRIVPLNEPARLSIEDYLVKVRPGLVKDKSSAKGGLFLSLKLGKTMSRQAIWLMIKKYVAAAGIHKVVTPHTFRHSIATHLLEGGAGLRYVQEFLGHVSIETTTIYTHLNKQHLLEVVRTCHPRK